MIRGTLPRAAVAARPPGPDMAGASGAAGEELPAVPATSRDVAHLRAPGQPRRARRRGLDSQSPAWRQVTTEIQAHPHTDKGIQIAVPRSLERITNRNRLAS